MIRMMLVVAIVSGCSNDRPAAPALTGCPMAAEKIWTLLALQAKSTGKTAEFAALATRKAEVSAALAAPCTTDVWPPATLACFAQLPPAADFKLCRDALPEAARANLKIALITVGGMLARPGSNAP